MKMIRVIKADQNNDLIKKINNFLFQNDMPESIRTRLGLIKNLKYYIEDAYTKEEALRRTKDAEKIKEESYKFYVIDEYGLFTGFMTLEDAINKVIKDYKKLYEDQPDKVEEFVKKIYKLN